MRATVLRFTELLLAGAAIGGVLVVAGQAQNGAGIETVATFDSPGLTENICQKPDGVLFVTQMEDRVVWKISPQGVAEKFASLPSLALILGVAPTDDSVVVTAADRTFRRPGQTPASDLSDVGPKVIVFDKTGKVAATVPGERGQFFNGIVAVGDGKYLIADTNAATLWQFDLAKKRLDLWLRDDAIAGANGVKIHNGWVYLSTRAGIQRIQLDSGKPKGGPIMFAKDARADDFDIAKDGSIYFPTNTGEIIKVSPNGEISKLRESIQGGPAAVVSRDGRWLYWPTRGGEGPQKVLRVAIQ